MSGADVPARGPDCLRCRAYFVTYAPELPHGCRTFGFKSRRLPRDEVRFTTGAECSAFEERITDRPAPRDRGDKHGSRPA